MIKTRIKNRGSISAQEIKEAYIKTFNLSWCGRKWRLWIADETYKPIDLEQLKSVLEQDKTNLVAYQLEGNGHFDCDDFAYRLMGVIHQDSELSTMPFYNTWIEIPEGGHALLSFYKDNEVWLLEPQNDSIYRVPEGTKLIKMAG
jgi:hypothetical protein